ncbi:MAG TPA: dienelactone hydrolase family protein, partial [Verrucomicrobiota bacterium]|nr:dienelactone hydrolase family protein [Verrucomicrobiota bacterium]
MAAIQGRPVIYHDGDTKLEGWVAYDDAKSGPRPAVLVVHQWKGLGDYEKKRAEMLAKLGYVAFCADIYGQGVRADNPQDASKLAAKYKDDRPLL